MPFSYAAEAADLFLREHFGNTTLHPSLVVNGTNHAAANLSRISGSKGRSGIVKLATAGASADTEYLSWGAPHQPSVRSAAGKPLISCNGGGYMAAKLGTTEDSNMNLFVGWIEETDAAALSATLQVNDFLTTTAAGVYTKVGTLDFAGIIVLSNLSADRRTFRAVSSKSLTSGTDATRKFNAELRETTTPNDGYIENMPELRVGIDADGDVHCGVNGIFIDMVKGDGLDPEKAYRSIVLIEARTGSERSIWLDFFVHSSQTFAGFPPEAL